MIETFISFKWRFIEGQKDRQRSGDAFMREGKPVNPQLHLGDKDQFMANVLEKAVNRRFTIQSKL